MSVTYAKGSRVCYQAYIPSGFKCFIIIELAKDHTGYIVIYD